MSGFYKVLSVCIQKADHLEMFGTVDDGRLLRPLYSHLEEVRVYFCALLSLRIRTINRAGGTLCVVEGFPQKNL